MVKAQAAMATHSPLQFVPRFRESTLTFRAERVEPLLFALLAGAATLWAASLFYAAMHLQLLNARMWAEPNSFVKLAAQDAGRIWSAPLDDVFIHFDFARAIARGHPFEWSEGNGYSSGGTSLLYPFALAIGYRLGFREQRVASEPSLMLWAALLACVCVFALLLATRRLFSGLPPWAKFLAIPFVLGIGALDWTLFSGMEVAMFLAAWGGALIAWDDLTRPLFDLRAAQPSMRAAWIVGAWNAVLVALRPEAVTTTAVFAIGAALSAVPAVGRRRAAFILGAASVPALALLLLHTIANFVFTGDTAAAGAIAKLELYHPYLTRMEVFGAWWFHVKYQVLRITQYHFSSVPGVGWFIWPLALAAPALRTTRRFGVLLWANAVSWVLIVALNGQVRWQNERYTMPAVAWLLMAAALGTAGLWTEALARGRRGRVARISVRAVSAAAIVVFAWFQVPNFRGQVWFFGRASRNILEQHMQTGYALRHSLRQPPRRVLVGDAGAIPFVADLPALDIIGLGGYGKLPFSRATRLGMGAAIELIERMPVNDRPDIMAIYPSWWGDLPVWFGRKIGEIPALGNVICGAQSDVIYRADWSSLAGSDVPEHLDRGARVVDALDQADLVNEQEHDYRLSARGAGVVTMKMLPRPRADSDLWDAGRMVGAGVSERFRLHAGRQGSLELVFRLAPTQPGRFDVRIGKTTVGSVTFAPSEGWLETKLALPNELDATDLDVELISESSERTLYHVWLVSRP